MDTIARMTAPVQLIPGVQQIVAPSARRRRDHVRAVRDLLRHELLCGNIGPGTVLPSEEELEREYSVGRNVIRLALAALQQEGLIRRVQGSGTFVRKTKLRISRQHLNSLAHAAETAGPTASTARVVYETQLVEYRPAPGVVAAALEIPVGATIAVLERKSFFGAEPCSLTTRYVPGDVAARLEEGALRSPDWLSALEAAFDEPVVSARVVTEAALADELLAPDLGVLPGAPILLRHLYMYSGTGRVVAFMVTRMRGDLVEIENWVDR